MIFQRQNPVLRTETKTKETEEVKIILNLIIQTKTEAVETVRENLRTPVENHTGAKVKAGIKKVKILKTIEIKIEEKTLTPQIQSQEEKERINHILNINLIQIKRVPNQKRIMMRLRKKRVSVDLFQSFLVVNA